MANALGEIVYMNPVGARILGLGVVEGPPETWSETYGVFEADGATRVPTESIPLVRAVRGETTSDAELVVRNARIPEGVRLRVSASPIRDAAGKLLGGVVIFHDTTEEHRARMLIELREAQLSAAKEELEERVRERTEELALAQAALVRKERLAVLGQLAGGVAHQIRNPLAVIKNASYLLSKEIHPESATTERYRHALSIIHEEIERANRIIFGLLEYARVRSPASRDVKMREILSRALSDLHAPANTLVESIVGDERVWVDADQVQEALSILLRNALEAMPHGGTLRLRVKLAEDAVLLRISDTGTGLDPNAEAHLFEPLFTTKPAGLGLGLVTARTLVEAQGGALSLAETSSRGTSFDLRLPIRPLP